jgi:hypothetical protein
MTNVGTMNRFILIYKGTTRGLGTYSIEIGIQNYTFKMQKDNMISFN